MKGKRIIITIFIIFIIFSIISNYFCVNAANLYSIYTEANPFADVAGTILGIIKWGGIVILVGAIIAKGIKYVSSAPDGKAEIKKEIIMLVVGAILLFGTIEVINVIRNAVINAGLQSV